mmetsp:Transcript_38970/g.39665  ORF Transcript_38970/g.39665 Transcript_38970/m.39665 type:complete len:523 (+) Transcript_38970:50-1618(+)
MWEIPCNLEEIKCSWRPVQWRDPEGRKLSKRCSHTLSRVGSYLYAIGGGFVNEDENGHQNFVHFNDVWKVNPFKGTCQEIIPSGIEFIHRRGHSAVVYKDRYIIVFGGLTNISNQYNLSNDLYVFDTETSTWLTHIPSSDRSYYETQRSSTRPTSNKKVSNISRPIPRRGHISVIHNSMMYIIGGDTAIIDIQNIYILNILTWQWLLQPVSGDVPVELSLTSSQRIGAHLICVGGSSSFRRALQVLILNLDTFRWSDVTSSLVWSPAPSSLHTQIHTDTPSERERERDRERERETGPVSRYCSMSCPLCDDQLLVMFGGTEIRGRTERQTDLDQLLLLSTRALGERREKIDPFSDMRERESESEKKSGGVTVVEVQDDNALPRAPSKKVVEKTTSQKRSNSAAKIVMSAHAQALVANKNMIKRDVAVPLQLSAANKEVALREQAKIRSFPFNVDPTRIQVAVKFNSLLRDNSRDAKLIVTNLPLIRKSDSKEFMAYVSVLTDDINPVMMVRGSGDEVVSALG